MRIRIYQPIVPEYRVSLFEGLGKRYGDRIEIWASQNRFGEKSFPLNNIRYDYSHDFVMLGPLQWQRGLSLKGLSRGDVVVVSGDIHQLSSIFIAFRAKIAGIRVVWWGHHVSALAKEVKVRIRLWIAKRLSDVMLCYTDVGVNYLEKRGFKKGRVFATGNTLDLDLVEKETAAWDGVRKFGEKKTLIFCGVLREKVRLDVLLRALKILKDKKKDFHCIIIGDGEKADEWRALAHDLDIDSEMTWTGELRGQDKLAPWFLSSDLFVYPGRIGLSIIHAFSFGLPVVLNDNKNNHGPEYSIFKPGYNGWTFKENDPDSMAIAIDDAMQSGDMKNRGQNGKRYVINNLSMNRMVDRCAEAIETAAAIEM